MKSVRRSLLAFWLFLGAVLTNVSLLHAQESVWATAYYAGWKQGWANNGHLPAQAIDYSAVTHIIHFSLVPNANGTLNADANSITPINSTELLTRAHAAGKKVLISVGGWNSDVGFRGATSTVNRALFVTNLVTFLTTRGYDGIDIDWEPLQSSDAPLYTAFIAALRTALDVITPRPLLTSASGNEGDIMAQIHQHFDQINIMTYDLSGAWPGWVTWHNAPIHDGGFVFPTTGGPVPSIHRLVNNYVAAGVPAGKIGIGIDFYGYVWNGGDGTSSGGATEPRQGWTAAPTVQGNVPYHTIMQDQYQPQYSRWDDIAKAAYLEIDNPGSANDKFISYDDQRTVQEKFTYVRSRGLGGLIIWELGGGYRPTLGPGQRDSLLQVVKAALNGTTGIGSNGTEVPTGFFLGQNYPNPFNPTTNIDFHLPMQAHVQLKVYDMLGQEVATIVNQELPEGSYTQRWNPSGLASGTYVYRFEGRAVTGEVVVQTRKLILVK